MLHDKDDRNRRCKIDLFKRLDEYLIKNESKFMQSDKLISRKTAQQFLISLAGSAMPL